MSKEIIRSQKSMSCDQLKGVGPQVAARLAKLGIHTVQDLLFHLPFRYQDRTRIIPLGSVRPGQQVTIEGEVELTEVSMRYRRQLLCRIADGKGSLTLRFFYFNNMQQRSLVKGVKLRCFGEVRFGSVGYEMIHPEYQIIAKGMVLPVENTLTPIYHATEKLHQLTLRKLINQALDLLRKNATEVGLQELLPDEVLKKYNFSKLREALLYLHKPPPDVSLTLLAEAKHPYQQRLIFEELLAHHLSLRSLRERAQHHVAVSLKASGKLAQEFITELPFKLTAAQQRVANEIEKDLEKNHPMLRLVQGDVGCGKTVVAALAALVAVENKCQVAIMAPTELLAEQHLKSFSHWLSPADDSYNQEASLMKKVRVVTSIEYFLK